MNFKFLSESPWKGNKRRTSIETVSPILSRNNSRTTQQQDSDRFIPFRINEQDTSYLAHSCDESSHNNNSMSQEHIQSSGKKEKKQGLNSYQNLLQNHIINPITQADYKLISDDDSFIPFNKNYKFLKYKKSKAISYEKSLCQNIGAPFQSKIIAQTPKQPHRKIPKLPYKILDAPSLIDDYYLNLIDWGASNDISIGLDNAVYVWSTQTNKASKIYECQSDGYICSLSWDAKAQYLAIGESDGRIKLFDVQASKVAFDIASHECRVSSLAWNDNLLSSGSRDRRILTRDIRCPEIVQTAYLGHKQEVCGLKWSPDKSLLASGGNDNKLFIWNLKT